MTSEIATVAAWLLACVFLFAAAAKIAHPAPVRAMFSDLGLPAPGVLARAVPVFEALLAAGLFVRPGPAAVVALVLLGAFSVVLGRAVLAGSAVPCGCFGSARTDPVSSADLVRNALLAALAVLATGTGEPVWPSLAAAVTASGLFAGGAVVLALTQLAVTTGAWWRVELPDLGPADDPGGQS